MKQSTRIAVVFGVLLVVAAAAWFFQSGRAGGNGASAGGAGAAPGAGSRAGSAVADLRQPAIAVPVRLAVVEPRTVPITLRLMGRAEAYSTVSLRARIDGQIVAVDYEPGQTVRRGQTMVRLDDRLPRAQEAQARANLARDQASLGRAVADLKRTVDLRGKGFVSSAQVDAAQATMGSLKATVAADEAALDMARTQLDYTRIVAPIDGVAGSVLAFPGSIVRANDTPLVVINEIDPIRIQFSAPEGRLAELRLADGSTRDLEVRASLADGTEPMLGRLSFIDNAVDPTTGTIALKADFANPGRRLTPGQFAEVALVLRVLPGALVIPAEALQNGPVGPFVYVALADGTVDLRPVTVAGDGEGATLIISDGLAAGDRIVVDGQLRLTPGARYSAPATDERPVVEDPAARGDAAGRNGRRVADPS